MPIRLGLERGDDEARIGLACVHSALADDAAPAVPAVAGGPQEVLEAARGPAGALGSPPWPAASSAAISPDQPGVAGQAEQVIDAHCSRTRPSALAGEAGIGAQARCGPWASGARSWRDDAGDLLDRARPTGIDVGASQLGRQQVIGRRRRRAADSSSSRSSRGRSALPGGRAADRRWHPDRARSALGAVPRAPPGTARPTALSIAAASWLILW